jgi:hypothetical protein
MLEASQSRASAIPRPRTMMLGQPGQHAAEDYPCYEMEQQHLTTNERH